jgi:hypothetical protein
MRLPPALRPVVFVLACARVASAQGAKAEPPPAGAPSARALFDEATRHEKAERWAEALAAFQRILPLKETASVRFHAAYCAEKLGQLAAAHRDYERALELARSTQGPDRKLIIEQSADALKDLTPRVPEVTLQLPRGVEGVRVTLDNVEVPAERAASPLRVDPGLHKLSVSAADKKPFEREFSLEPRERHTVVVFLESSSAPAPSPAPAAPPASARPADRPAGSAAAAGSSGGGSAAPWIVGGASVAMAGVGVGFFLAGRKLADDVDRCQQETRVACDLDALTSARTTNYAIAGAAGALSLVGAGVTIALALSKGDDAPSGVKAASGLVVTPNGLGWAGRF